VSPAWIWGRLFRLTPAIPAVIIPFDDILACGTADIAADVEVQEKFELVPGVDPAAGRTSSDRDGWKKIQGELLIFDDPHSRLPVLDALEDYNPGLPSTYLRVLGSINLEKGLRTSAWVYIAGFDPAELEECTSGNWA